MEFSSAGRAMVANGIPGLKRLRLRHRPALVRDDGDGFLTNLHGQLVDCPFARAGNDRDVVSANAGTHTPCRSFWSTLVDDFRSNDSLWLWVPHRASLVRDDGGGFSHLSFQTATREHFCSVIASAAKQSIVPQLTKLDCFAALAMTGVVMARKHPTSSFPMCNCTSWMRP